MRWRGASIVGAVALTILTAWPTAAQGLLSRNLQLSTTLLTPGKYVTISGSKWPTNASLQATVCGDDAVDGSVDCATVNAMTFSPNSAGQVSAALLVVLPPKPCPCVVMVESLSGFIKSFPVEVIGAPIAPVTQIKLHDASRFSVVNVYVVARSSFWSFFGAPTPETLVVTLRNNEQSTSATPLVSAVWGRGPHPAHLITLPKGSSFRPGETRTLDVPFDLAPLSLGTYNVAVRPSSASSPQSVGTTATTWPYGLFFLPLVVVMVVLFRHRKKPSHAARISARKVRRTQPSANLRRIEFALPSNEMRECRHSDEWRCCRCCCAAHICTEANQDTPSFEQVQRGREAMESDRGISVVSVPERPIPVTVGARRGRLGP
jgi:hypothetical protein